MDDRKKAIVLVSGGMDSVTALYESCRSCMVVCGVSFDYGSKHNHREIPFAEEHCRRLDVDHVVIKLDFINRLFHSDLLRSGGEIPDGHYEDANMKRTVVPFRNGIMLSVSAGLAESRGADEVVIAAHTGDHAVYPDCREEFTSLMSDAMSAGTYAGIRVSRPFIDMDKSQIVRRGQELGVDYSMTWSCYRGGERHCGTCGTCVERREAFVRAGLRDPTAYESRMPVPPGTRPE